MEYLWLRLPLILLLLGGYLVYLLSIVTRLTDAFVSRSLYHSGGRTWLLLLYILGSTALVSAFLPNTIAVLALIPLLKRLDQEIRADAEAPPLTTALTLATIYGANIGGMGSLIGSPANLLLIGMLDFYRVPAGLKVNFFNWFLWSVPLVAVFIGFAWLLLIGGASPPHWRSHSIRGEGLGPPAPLTDRQRAAARLFCLFLGFWTFEAMLRGIIPGWSDWLTCFDIIFFGVFLYLLLVWRKERAERPLLIFADLKQGIPKRGLFFLGIILGVMAIVGQLRLDQHLAAPLARWIGPLAGSLFILFGFTLAVIFRTEVLSNTLVAMAFFPVVYQIAQAHGLDPFIPMLAVSLASTCAFMTPIATPCNALAFGEMKGSSLSRMLLLGALLNFLGAIFMSLWLYFIIPLVYI